MDALPRRLFVVVGFVGLAGCSTGGKGKVEKAGAKAKRPRSRVPKNRSRGPQSLEGLMSMDQYVADLDHESADRRIEAAKRLGAVGPSAKSALPKLEKLAADGDAGVAAAAQAAINRINR
ncbi:MAG: hypothetical protein ACK6CT_10995 [Planctomycetia bacterium]